MKTALLIIILASCSLLLTYLIRRVALRKKIVSVPNERSLHIIPTPVGGGLAIVITWYIGISILFFSNLIDNNLYYALLSGALLALVSFIDDLVEIKPIIRLFFQFATAITAFILVGGLRKLVIPGFEFNYNFIVYPIAITGIVWFINLYNFMDGIDGFASIEAICVSLVLFSLSGSAINLILAASVAGFLFWNWPKARIFMGDVGSTQLGFILVVLGIYFHNTFRFSILNWIMLTSPFWFDATLTLFRRWRNGENLGQAHRKHIYQRFVRAGYSHLKVDICLVVINLIVFGVILLYREIKFLQIPLFILTLFLFYFITLKADKKIPFK